MSHIRQVSHPGIHRIQAIFREADAFTGSAKQFDDMTLLIIRIA